MTRLSATGWCRTLTPSTACGHVGGFDQSGQHADERGFARTVAARQTEELTSVLVRPGLDGRLRRASHPHITSTNSVVGATVSELTPGRAPMSHRWTPGDPITEKPS